MDRSTFFNWNKISEMAGSVLEKKGAEDNICI